MATREGRIRSDAATAAVLSREAVAGAGVRRRGFLAGAGLVAGAVGLGVTPGLAPAAATERRVPLTRLHPATVASAWMKRMYDVVFDEQLTPPAAARAYAYVSLAMYESVAAGMPDRLSLAGQLRDLGAFPQPAPGADIDWPSALSAAVAGVSQELLLTGRATSRAKVSATYDEQVASRRDAGVPANVVAASVAHSRRVAEVLVARMRTDGYAGTQGRTYVPPVGPDKWEKTPPNYSREVEPFWGEVSPFVLTHQGECEPPPHVPYSEEPGSPFWQQAMTTYEQSFRNTDETRAIARFWTDNPGSSGLPSGHWLSIVRQVAEQQSLRLDQAVEAFALAGVALADAFLSCWYAKYRINLVRPITYVRRHIDPAWSTLVNTPQFPEYTSGHSVSSMAAATVLTDLLGEFPIVDDTHAGYPLLPTRPGDPAPPQRVARAHGSFLQAAEEAARSRIYGGIHYPMGIEAGKDQGVKIGELVLARVRTRRG